MLKEILEEISNEINNKVFESPTYIPGELNINDEEKTMDIDYLEDYIDVNSIIFNIDGKKRKIIAKIDEDYTNLLIGYQNNDIFEILGGAKIQRNLFIEKLKKDYKPLYELKKFYIFKEYRRKGLGTFIFYTLYKELKFNIMSDDKVFSGMKRIFDKESQKLKCDIVDIDKKEILYEGYKIDYKEDGVNYVDKNVYSLKLDKKNIRIIIYR